MAEYCTILLVVAAVLFKFNLIKFSLSFKVYLRETETYKRNKCIYYQLTYFY